MKSPQILNDLITKKKSSNVKKAQNQQQTNKNFAVKLQLKER